MPDSSHQTVIPFQLFPAADGWLVVACAKQHLWVKLCDALGRPELVTDPHFADFAARKRNRDEADRRLEQRGGELEGEGDQPDVGACLVAHRQ